MKMSVWNYIIHFLIFHKFSSITNMTDDLSCKDNRDIYNKITNCCKKNVLVNFPYYFSWLLLFFFWLILDDHIHKAGGAKQNSACFSETQYIHKDSKTLSTCKILLHLIASWPVWVKIKSSVCQCCYKRQGLAWILRNRTWRQHAGDVAATFVALYVACCSAQMAHKPVQLSRQQVHRAYCPNI